MNIKTTYDIGDTIAFKYLEEQHVAQILEIQVKVKNNEVVEEYVINYPTEEVDIDNYPYITNMKVCKENIIGKAEIKIITTLK